MCFKMFLQIYSMAMKIYSRPDDSSLLLHHMPQLVPQMFLLTRAHMHLGTLGIGQRADLGWLIRVVVDPHIIKGQAAAALEVQLHLGGDAGHVGRRLFDLLRNAAPSFYQVTYSSQNRMSITAAWARVASPWGLRVEPSPVPLMTPAPQAHCIAGMPYSATSKASV